MILVLSVLLSRRCDFGEYGSVLKLQKSVKTVRRSLARTHVCWVAKESVAEGSGCGDIHISSIVFLSLDSTRPGVDWQRPIATLLNYDSNIQ